METKDAPEAKRLWPAALAKWDAQLADWARQCNVEHLTVERQAQIASMWTARVLSGSPLKIIDPGCDSDIFECFQFREWHTPEREEAAWSLVREHAGEALRWAGVTASPESLNEFIVGMLEPVNAAYLQADLASLIHPDLGLGQGDSRNHLTPLAGVQKRLPPVPPALAEAAAGPATGPSIDDIYKRWTKVAEVKPRTSVETKYHVAGLKAFLGHDDAGRVSTADARKWRDALKEEGLNNNTINARMGAVRQVFQRATDDGLLTENPVAAALRLPKAAHKSWKPYTLDDAKRILIAARAEARPSRRWAHWVMAFTGMRVGEVLQLKGRDVRLDGTTWFMDVNEDDPSATVKNGQRRNVPIHPALSDEGFLAYARGIDPDASLFPDKKPDVHGKMGGRAWQVVGRWVRDTVGITDPMKGPDHSWRHYFEDALRAVEVPLEVRDAIIGHAQRTQGRTYGANGVALAQLARELAKVCSPFDAPPSDDTTAIAV